MADPVSAILSAVVNTVLGAGIRALTASSQDTDIVRKGSELNNLKVSSSSHGAIIPIIKGMARVEGNMFWANDLERRTHIETTTIQSGGGKGGGSSQTVTNETYTYHATFAVGLCLGPDVVVKRIYAANEIIYNVGLDADNDTISSSLAFKNAHLAFYDGADIQPIDPTIQSFLGADTSAYNGLAYVVFSGWDVTRYGGVPPLSFELVESGTKLGDQIQPNTIPVANIIQSLSAQSGLTGIVNTDLLTPEIRGLKISTTNNYRSTIDALMDAYFISATESAGIIKFYDRNQSSLISVPAADLGAASQPGQSPVYVTLTDVIALPREVEVSYVDVDQNLQHSSQLVRTEYGASNNKFALSFPIALNATEARKIADTFGDLMWTMRVQYEFSLPFKYIRYEPGDIITLPVAGRDVDVYINKITLGANGVIKVVGHQHDVSAFTSTVAGASSSISVNTGSIGVAGNSVVHFVNLPAVSENSNKSGFFAAISGQNQYWFGAVVYRSIDGGVAFDPFFTVLQPTPTGTVDTLIPSGRNRYFWDDDSSIDITLDDNYELESFNDSAVLKGKNLGLCGNELIQFGNVSKIGDKQYRLSHLLNGRGETWNEIDSHAVGERFMLISASVFVEQTDSEIGRSYQYKVVSNGQSLVDVTDFSFTNTGNSLRPLSVINIDGTRDGAQNLTAAWLRRSRTHFAWTGAAPVPLGEAIEQYEVDIMNSNNVVRTISTTSENITYTASDQVTDFGSTQASIDVNVYQLSAVVGRGHVQSATI